MSVDLKITNVGQFYDSGQYSTSHEACGLACLLAILRWLKIDKGVTLNQLIAASPLADGNQGLTCEQVAAQGRKHYLDCRIEACNTTTLKAHADAGRPAIVLLSYADIPRGWVEDTKFLGLHFEVYEGYRDGASGDYVLMDDVDRTSISSDWGTGIQLPYAVLDKAITDAGYGGKCVVVYGVLPMPPAPKPIGSGVTTSGLNLRASASLTAKVLWVIPKGATVSILDIAPVTDTANNIVWLPVEYGVSLSTISGWVSQAFINRGNVTSPTPTVIPHTIPVGPAHTYTPGDILNFRASAAGSLLSKLPDGSNVSVTSTDPKSINGLVWVEIIVGSQIGWVAEMYLKAGSITPPVILPPTSKRNFVGWHILPGPNTSLLEACITRLAQAGKPCPIVTVVDDPQLANRIKASSPKTIVVYRYEDMTNPVAGEAAGTWWDHRAPGELLPSNSNWPPDYYQFANEWGEDWQSFTAFYSQLMDIATSHKIRITVYDLPEGNPNDFDKIHMGILATKAANLGHVFNYHAYSQPSAAGDASMYPDVQDLELRWLPWLQGTNCKILFGEAGLGNANFLGPDNMIARMKEFNAIMLPYSSYIIGGGSWWTFGGEGAWKWDRSSCDSALAAYEAYVMANF